ncbi:hypothetical protein JX265_008666 [Neoarthrinium moseri]|uniref:C3H1-type domain-containing protein n=1 Tax=Neoarthrinium moseri TaxID=1658444 RepID=A0A9P9WHW8_9PEZI|nr:hypothetical protein JX265_008666 [Neoarthrinium moseri]
MPSYSYTRAGRERNVSKPDSPASFPFEESLPQYFIVRPDITKHTASGTVTIKGPMVPLIPVDQLPTWLEVVSVPRELGVDQMRGLRNLGEYHKDFDCYEVHITREIMTSIATAAPTMSTIGTSSGVQHQGRRECQHPGSTSSTITTHGDFNLQRTSTTKATSTKSNNTLDPSSSKVGRHRKNRDCTPPSVPSTPSSNGSGDDSGRPFRPPSSSSSKASGDSIEEKANQMDPPVRGKTTSTTKRSQNGNAVTSGKETTSSPLDGRDSSQHLTTTRSRFPSSPRPGPSTPAHLYAAPHHHYGVPSGPISPPSHPASRLLSSFPAHTDEAATMAPSYRSGQHRYCGSAGAIDTRNAAAAAPSSGPGGKGTHNNGTSSIFCRHWCHHGKCKWGPVCKYQHEMPASRAGLREVGLADFPVWYKAGVEFSLAGSGYWAPGAGATTVINTTSNPGLALGTGHGRFHGMSVTEEDLIEIRERLEMLFEARAKAARQGELRDRDRGRDGERGGEEQQRVKGKDKDRGRLKREKHVAQAEPEPEGASDDGSEYYVGEQTLERRLQEAELEDQRALEVVQAQLDRHTKAKEKQAHQAEEAEEVEKLVDI